VDAEWLPVDVARDRTAVVAVDAVPPVPDAVAVQEGVVDAVAVAVAVAAAVVAVVDDPKSPSLRDALPFYHPRT
jgi:hypothetical protein